MLAHRHTDTQTDRHRHMHTHSQPPTHHPSPPYTKGLTVLSYWNSGIYVAVKVLKNIFDYCIMLEINIYSIKMSYGISQTLNNRYFNCWTKEWLFG